MQIRHVIFIALLFICSHSVGQNAGQLFKEGKELRADGKKSKAIRKFEDALHKAESDRNVQLQMNCHVELAELKDNVINYKEALDHYKSFSSLYKKQMSQKTRDLEESVTNLSTEMEDASTAIEEQNKAIDSTSQVLDSKNEEITSLTTEQEHLEHERELERELESKESTNRRNIFLLILGGFALVLIFFGLGYSRKRKTNNTLRNKNYQIAKEKEKSENLLLNILPKKIADELKEFGKTSSERYESATVMFTDFKGFTKFAENNTPKELVAVIDHYFSAFDEIIERHNIEKIKTIGDAYLCVSGIPELDEAHVTNMINAAFEMQEFVNKTIEDQKDVKGTSLEMRVGIHCGPLVAGVVGSRKFAYDVWGDTVNIAARMEQSGEAGGINVSETVFQMAKDSYSFDYRGEVDAKNKGKMKMYFVSRQSGSRANSDD